MVLDTNKIRGGWYNVLDVHALTLLDAQISVSVFLVIARLTAEYFIGTKQAI